MRVVDLDPKLQLLGVNKRNTLCNQLLNKEVHEHLVQITRIDPTQM